MPHSLMDFTDIDYLKSGTERQRKAYSELISLGIFEELKEFDPILTGTVPLDIDLPESDLDIICHCHDHLSFVGLLWKLYSGNTGFCIKSDFINGKRTTVAQFNTQFFTIEIFAQSMPTQKQLAYRHMIVEHQILERKGDTFKLMIRKLKSEGFKTEPAFAKLLNLDGDPYKELLKLNIRNLEETLPQ
jgi:hypothetical protein